MLLVNDGVRYHIRQGAIKSFEEEESDSCGEKEVVSVIQMKTSRA